MRGLQATVIACAIGALLCTTTAMAAQPAPAPSLATGPGAESPPPAARTVDAVDRVFGLSLPDPYRWMEGADNAEFDAWLKAHGEYGRARLEALPTRAAWRARLQQASDGTVLNGSYRRVAGRVFFARIAPDGLSLAVREPAGSERVLVDARSLPPGAAEGAVVQSYSPSPDGKLVAVNVGVGKGMEVSAIRVLRVDTGEWLPDVVGPVWGEFTADWLADGSGFAYTAMAPESERPDGDPMRGMRARLHRLGTPVADDPLLLRAGAAPGAQAIAVADNEFPRIALPAGSAWAVAAVGAARAEARLCVAPQRTAQQPGTAWRCLAEYADGVQGFALRGDTLYLLTVAGHPNGRVLAVDLADPKATLAKAREVLPMSGDEVLTDVVAARNALYVKRMRDGADRVLRLDYATSRTAPIEMPFAGSIGSFDAAPNADGLVLKIQGWMEPGVALAWDPASRSLRDLGLRDTATGDYRMLASEELEAVSLDGTRVPLSVVFRADAARDGRGRALVTGYGGYGISMAPMFNPLALEWVKSGGVYAVCHVRGGGEKGDAWHRGGQGVNKHRGVEDFIGCAAELARRGFTTPARTALDGTSMGGVLVGGAITAYPERFGAALVNVGLLNPVRLLEGDNGANQIGELGDPRQAADLRAIAALDPYQRVESGIPYPAVLLQVGLKDSRVSPWHTGKFAARLAAATSSGQPVWVRTDDAQGHFAFTLSEAVATASDQYAFLDAVLPGE